MGWKRGEVWLTTDLLWFREQASAAAESLSLRGPGLAALAPAGAFDVAIPSGLAASRQRRAARRQKERSRRARAAAVVIGSTAVIPLAVHRLGAGAGSSGALAEDPPTLTMRQGGNGLEVAEEAIPDPPPASARARAKTRKLARSVTPAIEWSHATSRGLPYAGSLVDGTRLPAEGIDWVTWNPVTDSVPNAPNRLFGHERTIRTVVSVITAFRKENPEAARVLVGDISFRSGGPMDEHVSHQNGLDVDVYYPRRDHALRAPVTSDQVDRALAQDLLDRFVASGARVVFVGYRTGLHGPQDVVVPYPNHENHMHVRFPAPPS